LISLLKPLGRKKVKPSTNKTTAGNEANNKVKKQLLLEQRDQHKKKNIKKKERLKELEEEREKDKMKWQSFNNKVIDFVFNSNLLNANENHLKSFEISIYNSFKIKFLK
jgi:flagellar motility protein MotE (MotC chaperone)